MTDIKTQLEILKFLNTPQNIRTVSGKFKISQLKAYRILEKLKLAETVETRWENGKKAYQANVEISETADQF